MRPILSPRLAALNAEAFLEDNATDTTVDLAAHRGESSLDELDLGDDAPVAVTTYTTQPLRARNRARSGRRRSPLFCVDRLSRASDTSSGDRPVPANHPCFTAAAFTLERAAVPSRFVAVRAGASRVAALARLGFDPARPLAREAITRGSDRFTRKG